MAKYQSYVKKKNSFVKPVIFTIGAVVIGVVVYNKFFQSKNVTGVETSNENTIANTSNVIDPTLQPLPDNNLDIPNTDLPTLPQDIQDELVIAENKTSDAMDEHPQVTNNIVTSTNENAILTQARGLINQGEYVKARDIAEKELAKHQKYSDGWFAAAELISEINTSFIHKDLRCPEKTFYVVKSGDVLVRIAYKNNTTVKQILKNNPRLNPGRPIIHPQQSLSILSGNWHIEASKKHFTLALYNGNKLFKIYKISIGREGRTPVGDFIITDKVEKPNYRGIPFSGDGTTGNELGTHWMRIEPTGSTPQDLQGYGIHGTWEPESIGRAASNGCLRLLNDQVEELFDLLPSKLNTVKVKITD